MNHELHMKAGELEKVLAEHAIRVAGDQMASAQCVHRGRLTDLPVGDTSGKVSAESNWLPERSALESNGWGKMETAADQYDIDSSEDIGCSNALQNLRGKFYEKYMQKRDAKLREEWISKDVLMKALHRRLEESMAEMKARFSALDRGRSNAKLARLRREELRACSDHGPIIEGQVDFKDCDREANNGRDQFLGETQYKDVLVDIVPSKKVSIGTQHPDKDASLCIISSKNLSHRTANPSKDASVGNTSSKKKSNGSISSQRHPQLVSSPSKSSSRPANASPSSRMKPRQAPGHLDSEMPDLKKKNAAKQPSGISNATDNLLPRIHAPKRRASEGSGHVREEKPSCSTPKKKSSVNPVEFDDITPRNMKCSPVTFLKNRPDNKKVQEGTRPKSFLKKGSGARYSNETNVANRSALAPSTIKGEHLGRLEEEMEVSPVMSDEEKNEDESLNGLEDPPFKAWEDEQFEMSSTVEVSITNEQYEIISVKDISKTDNETSKHSTVSLDSAHSNTENNEQLESNVRMQDDASTAAVGTVPEFSSLVNGEESTLEMPTLQCFHSHSPLFHALAASSSTSVSCICSTTLCNGQDSDQIVEGYTTQMVDKKTSFVPDPPCLTEKNDIRRSLRRLLNFGRKRIPHWVPATINWDGEYAIEDGPKQTNPQPTDDGEVRIVFTEDHLTDNCSIRDKILSDPGQSSQSSVPPPHETLKDKGDRLSASIPKAPHSFFSLTNFGSKWRVKA